MKIILGTVLYTLINLLIYVNCDQNKINIQRYKFIKKVNSFYNDLLGGKIRANSEVIKFLKTKTGNYNTDSCNTQLAYYLDQFSNDTAANPELWALQLFDSSGKLPEGTLYGNKYSLGNFDQCLSVSHHSDLESIGTIKGQYCLVPMIVNLADFGIDAGNSAANILTITSGVCVPDTCEPRYLMELIRVYLRDMNVSMLPTDPLQLCNTDSQTELNTADIFMIVIMSSFVLLMLGSTAYDFYTTKTQAPKVDLFMAFSIITNGRKLFAVDQTNSPDVITCLNGIRVLSLVWIILGHSYQFVLQGAVLNMRYVPEWMSSVFTMFIGATHLGVDSFFFMSGLLVSWSVLKELNKTNGKLNIPKMYLHRYLRITPPLIMLILLIVTVCEHTGTGPFSKLSQSEVVNCAKWWWSALLYVQNYVNPYELCVSHSWYLQVDMQLFILSPLLLIPLWKWGRNMIPVIFTIIALSVGCYFATYYVNDFRISFFNGGAGGVGRGDAQPKIYYPTHIRMGTWLIGLLLAYLLMKMKNKKLNMPIWYAYGGWLGALAIIFAIIFGALHINQPDYPEYIFESAFYSAMHRVAWCTALAWIVFACHKGYGSYINSFLSHPMWLPFTRLSYSMYLLSYVLQAYKLKISKVQNYYSNYTVFNYFWGDFGITFTVAIFWVLAFESPVPILEKVIFGQRSKTQNNIQIPPTIEITTSVE